MAWGIKRSFMDYLLGIDDVRWNFSDGAAFTSGREIYFPLAAEQPGWPLVAFDGSATIAGHFGALQITLDRPVIRLAPGGILTAGGAELVTLHPSSALLDGDVAMWQIDATLNASAVPLFSGAYAEGEAFDPVTVRIPSATVPAAIIATDRIVKVDVRND